MYPVSLVLALAPVVLLLAGCGEGAEAPAAKVTPDVDLSQRVVDYTLDLPERFVKQEVQGIDSKVEEWRAPGVVVSTDFGIYGGLPECGSYDMDCRVEDTTVAGREATIVRRGDGDGVAMQLHVALARDGNDQPLSLNLFGHCDEAETCEETLPLLRTVRFETAPE